jgi:16S rRNA (adenine(1408)-N(1))-methyltransferase
VLSAARREPTTLAIGVDADAASLRDASRKAARTAKKGGLPNALFVVAAVEALPGELVAIADEVRIAFPWSSLLRGVLGADGDVLAGIARTAKPGAEMRALLSVTPHDGLGVTAAVHRAAYEAHDLHVVEERTATAEEIAATDSSWAKRLRAGAERPARLVRAMRMER